MRKIISCFLILLLTQTALLAQKRGKKTSPADGNLTEAELNLWDDAEYFYDQKNFMRALAAFEQLAKGHAKDPYFNYMTGICYLYKSDEKEMSLKYLLKADSIDHKLQDIDYFLGRAYHLNYKFDQAKTYLNSYVASNPPIDKKKTAEHYILYCDNAKILVADEVEAEIDNIGKPINSSDAEYVPLISSDESVMIFTYRGEKSTGGLENAKLEPDKDGEYYEDIYISRKINDKWEEPKSIGANINTRANDACIALSADGQKLFIFRSNSKDNGDIYMSSLIGNDWSTPIKLGKNINTKYWEGSVCLSPDEKTLYFASEKPGGFGLRDLYVTRKTSSGDWGNPENLGPKINTPYNDDAPFLHVDGKSLFFSSEGHNSMGGYDVFYTTITDNGFTDPINLGYPINTTEDDLYYVISADGERGFYSSNRKGGFGQQDIYVASPGTTGKKPIVALVLGLIKKDDKPVDGTIVISDSTTGENKGAFHSNSATGKYIIALSPGTNYKITFEKDGESKTEYVNIIKIDKFIQVEYNVNFYSAEYLKNNVVAVDTAKHLQNTIITQIDKNKLDNRPELCETRVYQKLLQNTGGVQKEGVSFTVELGRYENEKNFHPDLIRSLGAIDSKKDALGNTTFTIGILNTLYEADQFRHKVLHADSTFVNATVTVNDNGKRKITQEYYKSEYEAEGCIVATDTKLIASVKDTSHVKNPVDTTHIKNPIDTTHTTAGPCHPDPTLDFSAFVDKDLNDKEIYGRLMKMGGGMFCVDGLIFTVQIGAYRHPENFKYPQLKSFGPATILGYPDGITRFTMHQYSTLKDAETFRQQCIAKGIKDAWITAIYNGKRELLPELIKVNFHNRSIN